MSHDDDSAPDSSLEQRQARRALLAPGAAVGIDEAMVHRVVHGFYARIRDDAELGPIFNGAIGDRWDHHLAKMVDFWSSVLLMTGRYEGRPMAAHLRLDASRGEQQMPRLDQPHFDHWLALFRATVADLCPPDAAALFVNRAEKIAQSFVMGIRFHRGQEPDWLGPVRSAPASSP
jgi:hemoglobin